MAKKKNNQTVVNNIDSVNLDIDYDKLAEAIVKAQKEAQKRKKQHQSFRSSFMVGINAVFFVVLAIIAVLMCVWMWYDFINNNTYVLVDCVLYTIMFLAVVIVSVLCSIESWKDNDEDAIQHFNTNVSLVALIIAIIALVKGVG